MFASWWIFIMILTAFYTANLTAFLTLSQFTLPIHSVEDIANPTNTWCAEAGGAVEYSIKEDGDLDVLDESLRRGRGQFIDAMDRDRIMQLISNGDRSLKLDDWRHLGFLGDRSLKLDDWRHLGFLGDRSLKLDDWRHLGFLGDRSLKLDDWRHLGFLGDRSLKLDDWRHLGFLGVLFLHDKHWLNFFMLGIERAADEMNHCQYVLTTDIYLTRSLSFVYPKHSILPLLFDSIMLSYVESGIIKHLLTKDLPEAVICPLDLGSKERQLSNPDLITTYIVVVSGFTAACFVLLGERMLRRMCRGKISDEFHVHLQLPYRGGC
ncbi:hypothetical protein M8J77_015140 [Diaphorina citri]|nr:hypothetical protein M8J77_015140 [Diaphorina citri]